MTYCSQKLEIISKSILMNDLITTLLGMLEHLESFVICKLGRNRYNLGGMQLWKNIPDEIKSSESYNIFKKKAYKKYLIGLEDSEADDCPFL